MVESIKIPKGYKQTEVGVIPEGWDIYQIGKHVSFLRNGSNSRAELTLEGGVKYLHYGDIHGCKTVVLRPEHLPCLSLEKAKTLTRLQTGDLVFADASEDLEGVGKSVEISNLSEQDCVSGLHTIAIRFNKTIAIDGFKGYLQFHPALLNQLRCLASGTKVYATNKSHIAGLKIPLPPKDEQKAIAKALSDVDSLIDSIEKLIAKKQDIKVATMQQLLTSKKRLPGFTKKWKDKKIGEFTNCTAGGTPSTKNAKYWGGNIKWMSSGELNMKFVKDVEGRITQLGLNNSSTKLIPSKCVLVGLAGQGKTRGTVALNYTELCTNQSIAAIFPNNSYISEYLYYNLDMRYDELRGLSTGDGGRGGLNLRIIRSVEVPFPELAEQEAIANVLLNMDTEIELLQKKLAKTQALKQGMMQELLTGRIRFTKAAEKSAKKHNWAIDEAVIISTLVHKFGSDSFPLGRKRYTKMSYLFHRYIDGKAEGYLKKAAGPYNPKTKYGGIETLAQKNGYIQNHKNGKYSGFVKADKIQQALDYFKQWYGEEAMQWLEQFRYQKNDVLELWATVDMAVQDLQSEGKEPTVENIKKLIKNDKEWKAKLKRDIFSDDNIAEAISKTRELLTEAQT